jgi:hypothetical protein
MTTRKEVAEYLEANGWTFVHMLGGSGAFWEKSVDPLDIPGLPGGIRHEDPIIVVKSRPVETTVEAWLTTLLWSIRSPSDRRTPEHYAYPIAIAPIIERFRGELNNFGKETT